MLQRVKNILETSRSRMQQLVAACTRAETLYIQNLLLCYLHLFATSCSYTSFQDGLDSYSLRWWCFFLSSTNAETYTRRGHHLQLALMFFRMSTCPFTGVHKHIWLRIATYTACGGIYIYICNIIHIYVQLHAKCCLDYIHMYLAQPA